MNIARTSRPVWFKAASVACLIAVCGVAAGADDGGVTKISITIDRGSDVGQNFGSLFEARSTDGSLVVGAGFQNSYN